MQMGTALNGMSLAQDAPKHGSWQSSVQIAEHDPAAAGMMPLIPHHNGVRDQLIQSVRSLNRWMP